MRFMILIKSDAEAEAGVMPSEEIIAEMGRYNEELVNAGVLLAAEGLHPSEKGKRVTFTNAKPTVVDGPFTETKELIAGFWIIQVRSMDEAVEWAKRCPSPPEGEMELEIRPVFELDDFGPELTPELRAQEESQRERMGHQQS